jgi:hypothetical protein
MRKTQPLYCWEGVFTTPFYNNGSYSIVVCVFFAAKMCLPNRCLAMNVYSDFTTPAFGRHVTIFFFLIFPYIIVSRDDVGSEVPEKCPRVL